MPDSDDTYEYIQLGEDKLRINMAIGITEYYVNDNWVQTYRDPIAELQERVTKLEEMHGIKR